MKKQNKFHKWPILIAVFVVLVIAIIVIIKLSNPGYSLSLSEKKWINDNKNNVVDIAVTNNIPIFSMEGEGLFHSFLDYFQEQTELVLNMSTYTDSTSDIYSFKVDTDEVDNKDLIIYEDNYVVLSKENNKIEDINSLSGYKIGVLASDIGKISDYVNADTSLTYVTFENSELLILDFADDSLDYIILPRNQYLNTIISNNYSVVYNLSGLTNKYILTLTKNKTLNSIIEKKYKEWSSINYNNLYIEKMNQLYFDLSNTTEKEEASFKSKIYIYGYIDNLPYDSMKNGSLIGLNSEFINGFEEFSGTKFLYKKYNNIFDLQKALNEGKVDLVFNYYVFDDLKDINNTIGIYSDNYVILSHIKNNVTIDSLASLKGKEIYTIKDTMLAKYINSNTAATVKAYTNINSLLRNKQPLILLDINMYNFYKNTKLKDYYIVYEDNSNQNYNFIVKQDETNNIFTDVFQYYLININHTEIKNKGMFDLVKYNGFAALSYVYYVLIAILLVIFGIIIKKKRKIKKVRVEEKSRYIDPLTSLKNRNYLSLNMSKWDDNNVYPQAIIMIDLNKLKDVNNNFGYEEGDKLIRTAANILVNNQLERTDIIRTDGNEFMIYMVGYEENQVIAYMRKLYKLMNDLPYGFGATLGYSMILDDVKLIEDAINEATLDMVTNKELKSQ